MLKGLFGRQGGEFRTRSADRDRLTDAESLGRVAEALESALDKLQSEYNGLSRRVDQAAAMASLAVGNESDEYLSREVAKTVSLREFEDDMKQGRDRLRTVEQHILNLRFLRAAFLTRFPNFHTPARPLDKAD
jgi:hypothetical protein